MRKEFQWGIAFALVGIVFRVLFFQFLEDEKARTFSVSFYLLGILLASFLSMNGLKRKNPFEAIVNYIKAGLRSALVFALLVSAFSYVNYTLIQPQYLNELIEERVAKAEAFNLKENLPKDHPNRAMSQEEFVEKERTMAKTIYSPFSYATFTLISFVIAGLFYAIFLSIIFNKVLKQAF